MKQLPSSWAMTPLGSLIDRIEAGLNVKCAERPPSIEERGLVKISAVTWGRFDEEQSKTLPADAVVEQRHRIRAGDLLISRANTIELVGASVIVERTSKQLYLSDKVLRLITLGETQRWINYALKTGEVRKRIQEASSGNQLSMRNISQDKLRAIQIPLAPSAEQKRIADKLDTILARVDACRERLDRVPEILTRFRQSVLASAASGKLTDDWRKAKRNGHGVWAKVTLADVCRSITDGDHQAPPQSSSGIPFITIAAINDRTVRLEKATRFVPPDYFNGLKPERRPETGDVLFSVTGSICIPAIVEAETDFAFQRHIAILKPDTGKILPRYLYFILATDDIAAQGLDVATGTAQLTVPLKGLRGFSIDLPPIREQAEIIRRIDRLFEKADLLESHLHIARKSTERLTPALLAKAFRGELVPQNPNDEPAAELLKRLAKQLLGEGKTTKGNRAKGPKPVALNEEVSISPE